MNGGMNGTMEEPMETSPPNSPVDHKKVPSINSPVPHHNESNNIDTELTHNLNNKEEDHSINEQSNDGINPPITLHSESNNIGTELTHSSKNDEVDHSSNDMSSGEGDHKLNDNVEKGSPIRDNDPLNSHCSNSNESFSRTDLSPHSSTENADNIIIGDEKCTSIEKNCEEIGNINNDESDEIDSEEDSSDEENSEALECPKVNDTVSINSDSEVGGDESSQEGEIKKDNDIIILENDNEIRPMSRNGNLSDSSSPEVHEIPSDNDDSTSVIVTQNKIDSVNQTPLRRSNRSIKRKTYTDDSENGDFESDVEEVVMEDPLSCKIKPIVINDTKTLVEMAARQMKSSYVNQRKDPTVVIIDTNSRKTLQAKPAVTPSSSSINANLYQSIVARGTTVTPVSVKTSTPTQSPQVTQPSILPSLTDDMFVVEAPSFIVPYVYEKPSVKPFREFVDVLGKELEEKRAKDEQEKLEKEKVEKEKRDLEKKARRERGEVVEDSEEENIKVDKDNETAIDLKKKKKAEKRERRKRRNDDDDASWDGESSSDSEDEETMTDDETVIIKDKADSIEEIKDVTTLTADKVSIGKSDNYFDCSLGKFFVNIGLNLVQEYVQNDLLKQQSRKLYREKKSGHSTKATESSIASLMKNLEYSRENNAPYKFSQSKCDFCSFKSESTLVMNHHLETPHMKNNVYKCNYCSFEIRSPHDILYHMEAEHNVRGKLERAPAYHQCPNCPFEDNGKGKLARHQIACAKKFKPELNLAPPIEWEPPAKIPKITRARNNVMNTYQNTFSRHVGSNMNRPPIAISNLMPAASGYRPRGRSPLAVPPRAVPVHGSPIIRGGVMVRHNAPPVLIGSNYPITNNGKPKPMHQPSISITPLPRQPQPVVQQPTQQSKGTFVICEICDGYIKDLEQLRNHMQWIHKVKIHPKMIYNRPPLNCQKCQFRFFTDQGLERHLLGSHGLVTSSMQEAANKGKDAGRCPVCGRVYQWKLLNHVARDHNLTLKPAHLSYKCTVCTATFGMYKQFENHVYSAHSVVAKRVMDKSKTGPPPAKGGNDSLLKPLKINDEITIIPQPVKPASSKDK